MSVNQVILIGRLGVNPEIKKTTGGHDVAKFRMATSKKIKGTELTQWHNIVVFGKVVPYLANVKKGDRIYVEGELQYREYEKDGVKKYFTEIVANKLEFIDYKSDTIDGGIGAPLPVPASEDLEELPF